MQGMSCDSYHISFFQVIEIDPSSEQDFPGIGKMQAQLEVSTGIFNGFVILVSYESTIFVAIAMGLDLWKDSQVLYQSTRKIQFWRLGP